MNPFDLLQINYVFSIDLEQLEKNYLTLQAKLHPDSSNNKYFLEVSASLSAELNQAYQTLKDPLKRAEVLLQMQFISLNDQEQDLDLLQEILDLREQADSKQMQLIYKKHLNDLENAFISNNYELAKKYYLKLNYISRALQGM